MLYCEGGGVFSTLEVNSLQRIWQVLNILKKGLRDVECSPGSHCRGTNADTSRSHGTDITHHRVLVEGDVTEVARLLHLAACDALHQKLK